MIPVTKFVTIIFFIPVIFGLSGISVAEIPNTPEAPPKLKGWVNMISPEDKYLSRRIASELQPSIEKAYSTKGKNISKDADGTDFLRLVPKSSGRVFPPVAISGIQITSLFNEEREGRQHKGIDIAVPVNTPVNAVFTGRLYRDDQGSAGLGRYVYLEHSNGLVTYYGHLSEWASIPDGTLVPAGKVIGFSGNSGRSTGPHLHFAVKSKGGFVDPLSFFKLITEKNGN